MDGIAGESVVMAKRPRWSEWSVLALVLVTGGCDAAPDPAGPTLRSDEASDEEPVDLVPVACFSSKECPAEEYCATGPGECGREGVCTPLPAECDRTRDPVCSCDGVNFSNGCWAAADKQNVDFGGACPPPPCTSNAECGQTSYCARATGDCAGTGTCEPRPVLCSGAWHPVCGCNGKTYANACKAASVGVVVKKAGTC